MSSSMPIVLLLGIGHYCCTAWKNGKGRIPSASYSISILPKSWTDWIKNAMLTSHQISPSINHEALRFTRFNEKQVVASHDVSPSIKSHALFTDSLDEMSTVSFYSKSPFDDVHCYIHVQNLWRVGSVAFLVLSPFVKHGAPFIVWPAEMQAGEGSDAIKIVFQWGMEQYSFTGWMKWSGGFMLTDRSFDYAC